MFPLHWISPVFSNRKRSRAWPSYYSETKRVGVVRTQGALNAIGTDLIWTWDCMGYEYWMRLYLDANSQPVSLQARVDSFRPTEVNFPANAPNSWWRSVVMNHTHRRNHETTTTPEWLILYISPYFSISISRGLWRIATLHVSAVFPTVQRRRTSTRMRARPNRLHPSVPPEVHHPPHFTVQNRLGLDHSRPRPLHCCLHAFHGRVPDKQEARNNPGL